MSAPSVAIAIHSTSLIKSYPWCTDITSVTNRREVVDQWWCTARRLQASKAPQKEDYPLDDASPAEFLRWFVEDAAYHPDPKVAQFLLDQASQVDHSANIDVHDAAARDFMRQLLGDTGYEWDHEDSSKAVHHLNSRHPRATAHLLQASQVFFRFRMLDIYAQVMGLGGSSPRVLSQLSRPRASVRRLDQIYEHLQDWHQLLCNFAALHDRHIMGTFIKDSAGGASGAAICNEAQQQFLSGIQCLNTFARHRDSMKYDKVLANIMTLAACLWWFSMGFEDLPSDKNALLECISDRGQTVGLQPETWESVAQISDIPGLIFSMRNILHLAASFSPLIVLVPKKFALETIRRDHLLAHSIALGNQKPSILQNVEIRLWRMVLSLAAGEELDQELQKFMSSVGMLLKLEKDSMDPHWFIGGEKPGEPGLISGFPAGSSGGFPARSLGGLRSMLPSEDEAKDNDAEENDAQENDAQDNDAADGDAPPPHTSDEESTDDEDFGSRKGKGKKGKGKKGKGKKGKGKKGETGIEDVESSSEKKGGRKGRNDKKPPPPSGRAPDLPIVAVTEKPKRSPPQIPVAPADKSIEVGIKANLYRATPENPPLAYEFKSWKGTADIEHELFGRIMESIEQRCKGRPPHHEPSAQNIDNASSSSIFVTTPDKLAQLSALQKQEIFRHRHILESKPEPRNSNFDRQALMKLGALRAEREIQVNFSRRATFPDRLRQTGTLLDLLPGPDGKSRRGLNVVEIPMGGSNVPKPLLYSELASNEEAWQETRDVDGMMPLAFPSDQMVWATATTQDSTSWINLNDQGAGMAISVGAGFGIPETEHGSPTVSCDLWDHEGVLLGPGDSLYVKPGTPVYDLTAQDAIVHGRFFYSSSTSQSTVFAIIHNFVLRAGVTNQLHCERFTFLRRLMAMWFNRYTEDPILDQTKYPHVPDVRTVNGLKDVMAVGNILELGTVLDRRCYSTAGVHWRELVEMGSSRAMYRQLISIIGVNFVLMVEGKPVLPLLVFARSLVELAAAIVVYKGDMESAGHKIPGCSFVKVKDKMVTYFQSNYPELLPKLHYLIESRVESLDWTGPSISITMRTKDHSVSHRRGPAATTPRHKPMRDFIDAPIYIGTGDASVGLDEAKEADDDDDDDIIEVKEANDSTQKFEQGSAQVHKVKRSGRDAGKTEGDPYEEDPDIEIQSANSAVNQDTDTESEDRMIVESEDEIDNGGADANPGDHDDGMRIDTAESTTTPLNVEESLAGSNENAEETGGEDQGEASENLKSAAAGGSSLGGLVSLDGRGGAEKPVELEKLAPIPEDASDGQKAPRSKREGDKQAPTRIMTRGRGNAEKPVEPSEKLASITESSPWSGTKVVSAGPAKRSPTKRSTAGSPKKPSGKGKKRAQPTPSDSEDDGPKPPPGASKRSKRLDNAEPLDTVPKGSSGGEKARRRRRR